MSKPRHISFCTTVKNRAQSLALLRDSLADMVDAAPFELVVADFQSADAALDAVTGAPYPVTYQLLQCAFFNRAQGLNIAAAGSSGDPEDLLFFLDVDIVVPGDFCDRIRDFVQPGRCWFPICYSLHRGKPLEILRTSRDAKRANGWWRTEGKGMCGFTRRDFQRVRWRDEMGIAYGHEDGDLWRRARLQAGLDAIRERCPGLFHVWHPTSSNYRTGHHRQSGLLRPKIPPQIALSAPVVRTKRLEP